MNDCCPKSGKHFACSQKCQSRRGKVAHAVPAVICFRHSMSGTCCRAFRADSRLGRQEDDRGTNYLHTEHKRKINTRQRRVHIHATGGSAQEKGKIAPLKGCAAILSSLQRRMETLEARKCTLSSLCAIEKNLIFINVLRAFLYCRVLSRPTLGDADFPRTRRQATPLSQTSFHSRKKNWTRREKRWNRFDFILVRSELSTKDNVINWARWERIIAKSCENRLNHQSLSARFFLSVRALTLVLPAKTRS